MIPNDRGRSAQGPPRGFGPKIPDFRPAGPPGPPVRRGISAFVRMWPRKNGWAAHKPHIHQKPDFLPDGFDFLVERSDFSGVSCERQIVLLIVLLGSNNETPIRRTTK